MRLPLLCLLLAGCPKASTGPQPVPVANPSSQPLTTAEPETLAGSYQCAFIIGKKEVQQVCNISDGSKQGSPFLFATTDSTLSGSIQPADFGFRFVGDIQVEGRPQKSEADFFKQGGGGYACALVTSEGALIKITMHPQ